MAQGEAREGKWRGNWRMDWIASTLDITSELSVQSITTADVHNSASSSRLNWHPRRFIWARPFRRKTKSGFCACAITFQTQSTAIPLLPLCVSMAGYRVNFTFFRWYQSASSVTSHRIVNVPILPLSLNLWPRIVSALSTKTVDRRCNSTDVQSQSM